MTRPPLERSRCGIAALLFAPLLWLSLPTNSASSQCIDEAIQDELNARRRYRGVEERLFQKAGRHELSVMGGVYAADLLSASGVITGAYTYHFTESLGLELSFSYTRAQSELVGIIEDGLGVTLIDIDNPVYVYLGDLIWSLAYGKVRWFGGRISRFDFFLAGGAGVTDNQTATGLTFNAGIGLKFFFGEWFSMRFDVRDSILSQEALGESRIVNNITATFGLSMFMPFHQ